MRIRRTALLGLVTTVIAIGLGALGFTSVAEAAPTFSVSPNTGLANGNSVSISGSGLDDSNIGGVMECSTVAGQPTVLVFGALQVPVSCSNPLSHTVTTTSSGDIPPGTTFPVATGVLGPPATGTDSSGGNATTDAQAYPCPPTATQIAAGATCQIKYDQQAGGTASAPITFSGQVPVVTGVSPNSGPLGGGITVTITGVSLTNPTTTNVLFGTVAATNVTAISSTSVNAVAPATATGTGPVNVTVTTPAGTSATSAADQFTYTNAPIVTGLTPNSGPPVGGTVVSITGLQFTGATTVNFGSTPAASFTLNSDTSITATSPPGTGTVDVTVVSSQGTSVTSSSDQFTYEAGYWLAASDGGVFAEGTAPFLGAVPGTTTLNKPVVGMASTPDGNGYWLAAADGGVFNYGNAAFYGSAGATHLNAPVVGMASSHDGGGYWLVASDGGVFSYGDAAFYGSGGGMHLNAPIVGMAATPNGGGYWLVASDGGVFSYGDAAFHGSHGGSPLNKPVVGMASSHDGNGYWLAASDGGVFSYGDATFYGSHGGSALNKPVVGMAASSDGNGYWLAASDGGIFSYGDASFYGSQAGSALNKPVVGMAATGA
jgi:IPT/TIG domain